MAELQEPVSTPRPKAIYWVASLALAGILLYFSLQGIEWSKVWITVKSARPEVVALALSLMSLVQFIRSLRWRVLLQARSPVTVAQSFWATSAGYLGNSVLPARAGEVVRTLMICARTGMSRAFVLTTALSERVVDAVVLVTISALVLLTLQERPGWLAEAARPFAILGLAGVLGLAFFPLMEPFWERVLERAPLPQGLKAKLAHGLKQGMEGVRSFHDRGRLTRFLILTAVIWCMDGIITVVGAHSIGVNISMPVAFLLVAGLGLGSALPSTPGYVGIYQFVAVSVLTPFGLSKSEAIAYILLFQGMNYVIVLAWGLTGLARQRRGLTAS